MIAAIYARKSTDQHGVADDQKSTARQVERARAYARRQHWTVSDEYIYIDEGISGAEFSKRPGLARLMNALKPRPPFQVLILSEESRLGREQLEVGYALKQIMQAGVRVFFYLEDRERTLDSPTDKIMLSLTAFADELEREKARQRTYDAMQRKAAAGHVTGGRVFGYDNVVITTPSGQRSHVERRINKAEAVVIRRIFELSGRGVGQTRIARQLNAAGATAPRSQQDRPRAWAPSSVHEVLFRELYRGVITWNRSRKRNQWGQVEQKARPQSDWLQVPAPALRIVSDEAWETAHQRLNAARAEYERVTGGHRRPKRDRDSKYLLPSFARCGTCNGGLHVRSRAHGGKRAFFYACTSHYQRGPEVCPHADLWPMEAIDRAVLAEMWSSISAFSAEAVAEARRLFEASTSPTDRRRLTAELDRVDRRARLAEAIACGPDPVPALMVEMRKAQDEQRALRAQLQTQTHEPKWIEMERFVQRSLGDWETRLKGGVAAARQSFRELLTGPILCTPGREGNHPALRFQGQIAATGIFGGTVQVTKMASPTGFAKGWKRRSAESRPDSHI